MTQAKWAHTEVALKLRREQENDAILRRYKDCLHNGMLNWLNDPHKSLWESMHNEIRKGF